MIDIAQPSFFYSIFSSFVVIVLFIKFFQKKTHKELSNTLKKTLDDNHTYLEKTIQELKGSLQESSINSLMKTTETVVKLTKEQLDSNHSIISRELVGNRTQINSQTEKISQEIHKLNNILFDVEKKRHEKDGEIKTILNNANEQTGLLLETTMSLKQLLSNSQARGQWGERIAEDVLRLLGFVENINYKKQMTLASGLRPDYTFFLPRGLSLNMDVKFPIENYKKFHESSEQRDKLKYKKLFISDMKICIKDVISKNYIDPDTTVDCVLVFIPHEQVFSFIQQSSSDIFDYSLQNKIIMCSPITLFAVLSIIRKSIDNFTLEKKSNEMLALFTKFKKQWDLYNKNLDNIGKKINELEFEYQKLTVTRTKQLSLAVEKIEQLKEQSSLSL